jgi:hypothetical protein
VSGFAIGSDRGGAEITGSDRASVYQLRQGGDV